MADTKIEWADKVWNPVTGCTAISEGCQHCYARRMANRLRGRHGYPQDDPFRVTFHPDKLDEPARWKKPRKIFVCSMGDLFHPDVQLSWFWDVWRIMVDEYRHTFLVLTKRPDVMAQLIGDGYPPPNIWLGVTAENQAWADERIPILLSIPAAKHFVSVEPMLGPVDLRQYLLSDYDKAAHDNQLLTPLEGFNYQKLKWVICGPETGQKARPCKPEWIDELGWQSKDAGIPFFDKRKQNWIAREWPK